MGVVRTLTLPNAEAPPAGTVRFAVIGDYGSGRAGTRRGPCWSTVASLTSWPRSGTTTIRPRSTDTNDQIIGRFYYGALVVDATATRITFRFVNRGGRIVDEHSLAK